jgi:Icc-related predicted phosphoesterase
MEIDEGAARRHREHDLMLLLLSADLHGRLSVVRWLLDVAREHGVSAVVLAGDLFGCSDEFQTPEVAQEQEAKALNQLLGGTSVPVFYVMGNDDLIELNPRSEHVQPIHNRRIQFGPVNFVGYQYSIPFTGGLFEKPESSIQADLESLSTRCDTETIFVSHSPAFGILDPGFSNASIGSHALREFLETTPVLAHVHGHSHEGFGRQGKHFNVASAGRRRAVLLDVDTMHHRILDADTV